MKLNLDRRDLREDCRDVNHDQVRFEHFTPKAQAAIRATGCATFWEFDHSTYKVIDLPKSDHVPAT